MPSRSTRRNAALTTKVAELAVAVPQVVAHRMTRMAIAGPKLSKRDRKEFERMVAEKNIAFAQACQAMAMQAVRTHQSFAASLLRSMASPGSSMPVSMAQMQRAALGLLGQGMAPFHRKAVANAKRLARTRLR